jgi:hypothetical protein
MRRLAATLALVALAAPAAACGGDGGGGRSDGSPAGGGAAATTGPGGGGGGVTAADLCAGAALVEPAPTVAAADAAEVSGAAASRRHAGVVWVHDDSGGAAEVFAVGADGADLGRYPVAGAEARDWEDMAVGPGAAGDVLWLGDVGDNDAERPSVVVYRVPEPAALDAPAGGTAAPLAGAEAFALTYADGPRDAEALLADPVTGDLFVLDKDLGGGPAGAYRLPAGSAASPAAAPGAPLTLERVADVGLPAGQIVTGASASPDGALLAVRTYTGVYLWDRAPGQDVAEALAAEPCAAPSRLEPQGEAVAVLADARGYVTVSEGEHPPLHAFRLP